MDDVVGLLPARRGHFVLESGHHGSLWLDLELLCLRPARVRELARRLASRLARYDVDVVCGPLVEGAFVALMVAEAMGLSFVYAERMAPEKPEGLYPVRYTIPPALRSEVRERRVAIVNDVINAGSAVGGTVADLRACRANVVAIGSLAVLGSWAPRFASEEGLGLEVLASLPNEIWPPSECPLCSAGVPLT